ncbi:hypothetical protein M0657_010284 [Pyricularia oryzae]|uniref:Uncharacterized protein n=2 Tax=Pyricularia oryzae TaxID=318829 RepID=A0AA97PJ78_PYRO3|nr:hypothetical protein OOU_Y34scaffold00658g9 [Pyricularia oryzae Y34]KAI7912854.1 hypothetical protein M0657_010284 [Pyricularia oryzae]KAI7915075.1 hypothetical protein M9X92_008634 [Pyricularia oryzae]
MSDQNQDMARIWQPGPDDPLTKCQNKIHDLGAELLGYVRRGDGTPAYFDCDDDTGARTFVIFDIPPKSESLTTIKVDLKRSEANVKRLEEQLATQNLEIMALKEFYDKIKGTELKAVKPLAGASSQGSDPLSDVSMSLVAANKPTLIKIKATKGPNTDGDPSPSNEIKAKRPDSSGQDQSDRNLTGRNKPRDRGSNAEDSESTESDPSAVEDSEYSGADPMNSSDSEAKAKKKTPNPKKRAAATTAPSHTPQRKKAKAKEPEPDREPETYKTAGGEVLVEGNFIFLRDIQEMPIKRRLYVFEYPEDSNNFWVLRCPSSHCNMSGHTGWFVDHPVYKDYAVNHYMAFHERSRSMQKIVSAGGTRVVPDLEDETEGAMSDEQFHEKILNFNDETKQIRLQTREWSVHPERQDDRCKKVEKKAKWVWKKKQAEAAPSQKKGGKTSK